MVHKKSNCVLFSSLQVKYNTDIIFLQAFYERIIKMNAKIFRKCGEESIVKANVENVGEIMRVSFPKELIPDDCDHIDFMYDYLVSVVCEGYMLAPRGTKEGGTILCRFREREGDHEYISDSNTMPVFGFKTEEKCVFAIVTGMTYEYKIVLGVKNGVYYIYPRFFVDAKNKYEDIAVELYNLPLDSDYNDMAALYRSIKNPPTLSDKIKSSDEIKYALESPELRIRLAWKPVPALVAHQTEENEPPVVVGCTLSRAKDILDGMKARGVEKCEVCLVGVEIKGHDGRWPQLMPIEETIGGEEELIKLCEYGQSLGYQMVVHTNSTEMYEISSDWDENALLVTHDGDYSCDEIFWGGGQPFHICPEKTVKYTERNLAEIHRMGFKGLHYIDVITNFPPRACYSEEHPLTPRESAKIFGDIARKTRKLFGGFASEGGFDFAIDTLDFALYTCYNLYTVPRELCDETIPLWQLVYHGSVLYNPSTETVNYCVKDEISHLKFIEYGGRPLCYFNSKYVDEGGCGNWMGEEDLLCATDEQLSDSLDRIKSVYEEYKKMCKLQYERMVKHEKLSDGVYRTTYESGAYTVVDYNNLTYKVEI